MVVNPAVRSAVSTRRPSPTVLVPFSTCTRILDGATATATASSGRRAGVAGALVVAQVALSLVLLVGAGLFLRSFASLASRDLGFERGRALLVSVDARRAGLDSAALRATWERLRDVGQRARHQIEALLGTPVFLDLHVKIAKDWQRDPRQLRKLGF